MSSQQQPPQLPSPKILLPVGILLLIGSVTAFVVLDIHLISGAFAALLGLAGIAMAVQSVVRLSKGER